MSNIAERYVCATTSSKLVVGEATGDADVLIAAGWASRDSLATILYRMKHTGRHQGFHAVVSVVADWINLKVKDRAVQSAGKKTKLVVERTLFWWLNNTCPHCGGRGHPNFEGTPIMNDDEDCPECMGEGIAPLSTLIQPAHMDMAKLILSEIGRDSRSVFCRMEVALKG